MRGRLSDVGHLLIESISSRSQLKKAIKRKEIWVNGAIGTTGQYVDTSDHLLYIPVSAEYPILELSITVHYEDDHIAVIEKPAGLPVSGNRYRQLNNCLTYNLHPSPHITKLPRPLPTHRLDKATTGLLLCSKTTAAHLKINEMFANRAINKMYEAIVIGHLRGRGSFIHPIEDKAALTTYQACQNYQSNRYKDLTHLKFILHTGRTHQIRKHCALGGYPIMGDRLYCPSHLLRSRGLKLQATRISFTHPIENHLIDIRIPFKYSIKAIES